MSKLQVELQTFLGKIDSEDHKIKMEEIFKWIGDAYPDLKVEIKWNQPMFIDHGTFIIAFSTAKNHFSVAPEQAVISLFQKDIEAAGYEATKGLFKVKWSQEVNFDLLRSIIDYNIEDKKDYTAFWRK